MFHRTKILLTLLCVVFATNCFAQITIYPVQLNVQMLPPFTPCLSDYVNDDFSRLRVIALQRDMSKPNYLFAIKLTVKQGNSIYLQSDVSQLHINGEFKVSPGIATTISGSQLRNIFAAPMLTAPTNYNTNGHCLPEGYYEIIFQAFDANNTNVPVSDAASTFVYFQKGRPPYPLTPAYGVCIRDNTPVINFSWADETANFRSNKRYKLEIYEIIDDVPFQNIADFQRPIVERENIMLPFFSMHVTAGLLQTGKRYAWRVQAVNFTPAGYNPAALANDGYSEMFFFDYGACINPFNFDPPIEEKIIDATKLPELIRITTTDFSAHAVWKNEDIYDYFLVEYRRKDDSMEKEWISTRAKTIGVLDFAADSLLLNGIGREVTYEVRVQGRLTGEEEAYSQYSNIKTFKLEREEKPECGKPIPALTSTEEIALLSVGDEISANGYTVTITEVRRNADGSFTGYGKVKSPIFKVIPLRVKFDAIRINNHNELMQGEIITVYNLATSATLDLNGILNKGATGHLLNEQAAIIPRVQDVNNVGSGYYGTVVQDSNGNVYVIDEEGKATQVGTIVPSIAIEKGTVSSALGEVTFDIIPGQKMIIDREAGAFANNPFINERYETLKAGNSTYKVPWTLVPTGKMRTLKATVKDLNSKYKPEDIRFVCTDNVMLESQYNGDNTFTISVFGGDNRTAQGVYAVVKDGNSNNYNTLGKILMAHYTEKELDVVIVPVNREKSEINEQTIESELNSIYNPVGIKINVTVEEKFTIDTEEHDFLKDGLAVEGTTFLTNETDDMKVLKYLYKESGKTISSTSAYLFVLDKAKTAGVQGDMPRGKQVGYLFGDEANNARLIAHELGHGAFTLEHTFNYGVTQDATDNLMDYNNGSFLTCWQWELVHQPRIVWSFLDGDEEAMFAGIHVLAPNYRVVFIDNSSTLFVNQNYRNDLKTGTLPGFTVKNESTDIRYFWYENNYVNRDDFSDTYPLSYSVPQIGRTYIMLFYNLHNDCGKKSYIIVKYDEELRQIINGENKENIPLDIASFIQRHIQGNSKQLPCLVPINENEREWQDGSEVPVDCSSPDIQLALAPKLEVINTITSTTSPKIAREILESNYIPCLFKSIPLEKRIEILNVFLKKGVDDGWWQFERGLLGTDELFIDKIILSTPERDRVNLLKNGFLAQNNLWLKVLWDKTKEPIFDNDVNLQDITPLLLELGVWAMQYFDQLEIPITVETLKINDLEEVSIAAGIEPILLGKPNDSYIWAENLEQGKRIQYTLPNNNSGGIKFEELSGRYKITINQVQKLLFDTNSLGSNGNIIYKTFEPRYNKTFEPFEPVTLWIGNNYACLGFSRDDRGDRIVVPAILAALYLQKIYNDESEHNARQILNGVAITAAILAAPYSGGTSLQAYAALCTTAGGIVAAADIAVQEVKKAYKEDSNAYAEIEDAFVYWDYFYVTTGIVDAGTNLTLTAKNINIIKTFNGVKTTVKSIPAATMGLIRNNPALRDKLTAIYIKWILEVEGIKNIDNFTSAERQLLTEQEQIFHALGVAKYADDGRMLTWGEAINLISKENGFIDLLPGLLQKESLTMDDFRYMIQKNVNALTNVEKTKLENIRNALPKPDANTIMQKVIPKSDIDKYLSGDYYQVGGSVTRASDTKHLKSFEDLYFGERLDYPNSPFAIEDGSCGVIRFTSSNSVIAEIPIGGTYEYPFTATGFTSGNNGRLGVPEWNLPNRVGLKNGSELWQVHNDATEILIAIFDESKNQFILIK